MVGDELKRLKGPIFITGHTGFKGSWLILLLNHLGIEHFGYSLDAEEDSLYRRANLERVSRGVVGDIRDVENLSKVIKDVSPSAIIHLAAQPLVLRSYQEPLDTFQTNCMGSANVLGAAFDTASVQIVLAITTDKVYRNENYGRRFIESDPLEGKDPYSASKVAAEAVCASWQQISNISGGPKVIVARAGNVIGGGDFAKDRLLPDVIRAVLKDESLVMRKPKATRPWQHVLDPIYGYLQYIDAALQRDKFPHALNFGPNGKSISVSEIVNFVEEYYQGKLKVKFTTDSVSKEENSLDLDSTLAYSFLGWRPKLDPRESTIWTLDWWDQINKKKIEPVEASKENVRNFFGLRQSKSNS
jgi:CDP-glucose 4,6-dehydratase